MTEATIESFECIGQGGSATSIQPEAQWTMPDRWRGLTDELLRLRLLPNDWDGDGAAAPVAEAVDAAIKWIDAMREDSESVPPNYVSASPGGEILVVWQEPGFYLEAEIEGPSGIEWMECREDLPARQWTSDFQVSVTASC